MDSGRAAPSVEPVHKIQFFSKPEKKENKISSADRTDATAAATLTSGGAADQPNTETAAVKKLIGAELETWRDGFAWQNVFNVQNVIICELFELEV